MPPRARAVPPVRNTSASSMQSPPASAEATRVIILSPVLARGAAKVEMVVDQFGQAQAPGQGGRKDQPGIGHQAVIVEGDADAIGVVRGSIYWVLLFWGRFSVSKPLSQKHGSTFLPLQDADPTPSFGGFGVKPHQPGTPAGTPPRWPSKPSSTAPEQNGPTGTFSAKRTPRPRSTRTSGTSSSGSPKAPCPPAHDSLQIIHSFLRPTRRGPPRTTTRPVAGLRCSKNQHAHP